MKLSDIQIGERYEACVCGRMTVGQMLKREDFRKRFESKYGVIQVYAPYSYDAVYALVDAMKRANSAEPAKVLAELPKVDIQGVSGPVKFDAKGDTMDGAVTVYEAKGGTWQVLETVK